MGKGTWGRRRGGRGNFKIIKNVPSAGLLKVRFTPNSTAKVSDSSKVYVSSVSLSTGTAILVSKNVFKPVMLIHSGVIVNSPNETFYKIKIRLKQK